MLACWLLFPLVLALLSLGAGVATARVAAVRVPGPLLIPLGLAAIVVVAQVFVAISGLAHLATAAVTLLAIAGLLLLVRDRRALAPIDRAALLTAVAVYLAFMAPVLLSGSTTFLGYIKLDDTATWLNIVDHVMSHGRDLSSLAPSSGQANLEFYLHTTGYPVGTFLPWGVTRALVGQDAAWVFQPYLACLAAAVSLALYEISGALLVSRPLRGVVAFVGAQSALVIGFAWWGGVKELATTWLMALMAALVPQLLREPPRARAAIALAVPVAATVAVLGLGAGPWLAPLLLLTAAAAWRLRGRRWAIHQAIALVVLSTVLALAALPPSGDFLKGGGPLYTGGGLFNLFHPLSWFQLFGIWPAHDFRFDATAPVATTILIAVAAAAALFGIWTAWRRRIGVVVLYLVATLAGAFAISTFSSPWIVAKALTTASPAVLLAALLGAASLIGGRWSRAGVIVLAALSAGVIWSNVMQYGGVSLAPQARLSDLRTNAAPAARGHGPTLVTEPEIYADRHFLPGAASEGVSDLRNNPIPLRDGTKLEKQAFADIDSIQLDSVFAYPTIVMRRSPATSRPPSPYRLVRASRWYEVWRRPATPQVDLIDHIPLGDNATRPYCGEAEGNAPSRSACPIEPAAQPSCALVRRLARKATTYGGYLVAAARPPTVVLDPAQQQLPAGWRLDAASGQVFAGVSGTIADEVSVRVPGTYRVWLGGAFERGFSVSIDGQHVGDARWQLSNLGQYVPLASAQLSAGSHAVSITHAEVGAHPGGHEDSLELLGPLSLTARTDVDEALLTVPATRAAMLCGRSLDWIEIVRRRV